MYQVDFQPLRISQGRKSTNISLLNKVGYVSSPPINTRIFQENAMTKETDATIYFCITCLFVIWKSIEALLTGLNSHNPILKVTPEKKTPTQLKKMLKNDLIELVLEYQ